MRGNECICRYFIHMYIYMLRLKRKSWGEREGERERNRRKAERETDRETEREMPLGSRDRDKEINGPNTF